MDSFCEEEKKTSQNDMEAISGKKNDRALEFFRDGLMCYLARRGLRFRQQYQLFQINSIDVRNEKIFLDDIPVFFKSDLI